MSFKKEQLQANWDAFKEVWPKIWLTFGQTAPNDKSPLTLDVWGQVQNIPSNAWPYILQRVRELDCRPPNLAKYFKCKSYQWAQEKKPKASLAKKRNGPEDIVCQRIRQRLEACPDMSGMQVVSQVLDEMKQERGVH